MGGLPAMRPIRSGLAPFSQTAHSFRGPNQIGPAFFLFYSTIHDLFRSGGFKAVGGVTEFPVSNTRPSGVPSLGREPEKHRLPPLPRRALATGNSAAPPTTSEHAANLWLARCEVWHRAAVRGRSGWRRRRGGRPFGGSRPTEGSPEDRQAMERTAAR